MLYQRGMRVIKRGQSYPAAEPARPAVGDGRAAERAMRTVVSEWVTEHRQRSEAYRREYITLLKELGFR